LAFCNDLHTTDARTEEVGWNAEVGEGNATRLLGQKAGIHSKVSCRATDVRYEIPESLL